MKKYILLISWIFLFCGNKEINSQTPIIQISNCDKFTPYLKVNPKSNTNPYCRIGYINYFDSESRIPFYTSYILNRDNALGCFSRSNKFEKDKYIPNSSDPIDYVDTGYDRGHVSPSADMLLTADLDLDSFVMTNISPQLPSVNRGLWREIEAYTREYVLSYGESQILTGCLYSNSSKKIGKNKDVTVPDALYKVIINKNTNEFLVFLVNQEKIPNSIKESQTSLKFIEDNYNIKFITILDKFKKYELKPIENIYLKLKNQKCKK